MHNEDFIGFEDLGSDFDDVSVEVNLPETLEDASRNKSVKAPAEKKVWVENCPKCNGSGRFSFPSSLGHQQCTKCKGRGQITYKSSPESRAKNRVKKAESVRTKLQHKIDAFFVEHPKVLDWIKESGTFSFALSMHEAILKYGSLTERQLSACYRTIEARDKAQKEREEIAKKAKETGQVSIEGVEAAIKNAKGTGIKKPKMRLSYGEEGEMVIYEAYHLGSNAGSLYVKSTDDDYLGKITKGVFYRSREIDEPTSDLIVLALQNPLESAKVFGKRTGSCSCCGRQLDNAVSIELGIGPICLGKYFG